MESQLSTDEVTCKFCKDDMTPVTLALKVSELSITAQAVRDLLMSLQ